MANKHLLIKWINTFVEINPINFEDSWQRIYNKTGWVRARHYQVSYANIKHLILHNLNQQQIADIAHCFYNEDSIRAKARDFTFVLESSNNHLAFLQKFRFRFPYCDTVLLKRTLIQYLIINESHFQNLVLSDRISHSYFLSHSFKHSKERLEQAERFWENGYYEEMFNMLLKIQHEMFDQNFLPLETENFGHYLEAILKRSNFSELEKKLIRNISMFFAELRNMFSKESAGTNKIRQEFRKSFETLQPEDARIFSRLILDYFVTWYNFILLTSKKWKATQVNKTE